MVATVRLVIFEGLNLRGLQSYGNFMGLYFHGIATYSNHFVL